MFCKYQRLLVRPLSRAVSRRHHLKTATDPPSFNLPRIRDEVVQTWLRAEADDGSTTTQRTARYCNFTYFDGVRLYNQSSAEWHWLDQELSSNLAGETGAVSIYKGALAAMKFRICSKEAYDFVAEHMANEEGHLRLFEAIVPKGKRTILLPVWRIAGWTLGFLPTVFAGSRGLYVTVEAVESFVEEHFQQQIVPLKKQENTPKELVRLLEHCCADEVHHKEDAAQKLLGPDQKEFYAWWVMPWSKIVRTGSATAAEVARRI